MSSDSKTVILVVDDDPAVRKALKFSLEVEGFQVHACESGEDLLKHSALRNSDCIILDYMMPGMDGLQVLEWLTNQNVAAPVIFITGPVTKSLTQRALEKGARLVMEKPLLEKNLAQQIHELTS